MKEYTITKTAYTFEELTEQAKKVAYQEWLQSVCCESTFDDSDRESTLDEFCRIFDVSILDWEVDSCRYNFRFRIGGGDNNNIEEVHKLRLTNYPWNNYAHYIETGKFYSGKISYNPFHCATRNSKVIMSMNDCPLTGACYDCDILQPIIECLTYKTIYCDAYDLFYDCLDSFFKSWQEDIEYRESFEFFEEEVLVNDWEHNADGTQFVL